MDILPYNIDTILKNYAKQERMGKRYNKTELENKKPIENFKDVFQKEIEKKEGMEKISYSLVDIILKKEK